MEKLGCIKVQDPVYPAFLLPLQPRPGLAGALWAGEEGEGQNCQGCTFSQEEQGVLWAWGCPQGKDCILWLALPTAVIKVTGPSFLPG